MPHTILVADDEPSLLRLLEFMLTKQGHHLITATNGEEALTLAQTERPDLIVLDIMMPKRDGYSVVEAIRADPEIAQTPIILLTAKAQDDDIARGVAVGADTYITKPFSPEELVEAVSVHLAGSAKERPNPPRNSPTRTD